MSRLHALALSLAVSGIALGVAGCVALGGGAGAGGGQGVPAALARLATAPRGKPSPPARVLMLSIPGLTNPAFRTGTDGTRSIMPTLATLAEGGIAADRVEAVVPATAYPVHATFVTGREPRRHGILADHRLGERSVRAELHSHASHLQGASLWQAASEAGGDVAALDWPVTTGAAIVNLLPDLVQVRREESWRSLMQRNATPWIHERVAADPRPALQVRGPVRDSFLVDTACRLIASPAVPRLLMLRFGGTELALRRNGPRTEEVRAAFAETDQALARLARCLDQADQLDQTTWVVLGDGVFLPVHSELAVNEALYASGLYARKGSWRAVSRSNGGSAFVYARDARAAVAARQALSERAEDTRAFRIVSAEEMLELRADPEAWFGLEAAPGYVFSDSARGPILRPAGVRGTAGYLLTAAGEGAVRSETPAFVAFGPGVRRGLRIPLLRQTDVAPTVARLLDVPLEGADGRALVGALRLPPAASRVGATP